jgi:transposase
MKGTEVTGLGVQAGQVTQQAIEAPEAMHAATQAVEAREVTPQAMGATKAMHVATQAAEASQIIPQATESNTEASTGQTSILSRLGQRCNVMSDLCSMCINELSQEISAANHFLS